MSLHVEVHKTFLGGDRIFSNHTVGPGILWDPYQVSGDPSVRTDRSISSEKPWCIGRPGWLQAACG